MRCPLPPVLHGAVVLEPKCVERVRITRGVCHLIDRWKGEPAASSWEEANSFFTRFSHFQLEDELLLEGGGDVMWASRRYSRRPKPAAAGAQG
jgi:hypothetical protein